ncbi:MAG: hypothetical protein ACOYO0_04815 [Sandarakinorhabdus sp.]
MARYRPAEIERWIDDIEQRSLDRCRKVERYLLQEIRQPIIMQMPSARERLFAAMLTGDPELTRRQRFAPRWVSWIENLRPYALLNLHDEILVDLVPPDRDRTGVRLAFSSKYHCSVSQFVELVQAMPDRIRINIRNDNIQDYTKPDVIDDMGEILSLSEQFPDRFFKLRPIRSRAFSRLGVSLSQYESISEKLCANYPQFLASLPGGVDQMLFALTRAAQFPAPRQLVVRLSYYLVARQLWPDEQHGARDAELENWLQPCLDKGDAIQFDHGQLGQLTKLLGRLYATHHLFTAHLTGAMGGTYGWKPIELDFASQIYDRTVPPKFENGRHQSMSSWFFALQAGMINRPGEAQADDLVLPVTRQPNDLQWQSFLARVNVNRQRFRERIVRLNELAGIAGETRADLEQDDDKAVQQIVGRMEDIAKGGIDVCQAAGPVLGGAAAALTAVGVVSCETVLKIAATLYGIAKAVPTASQYCERLETFTNNMCKDRTRRTALVGALSEFDLPYKDVVALANPRDTGKGSAAGDRRKLARRLTRN